MRSDNILAAKSYLFALRIIKLFRFLSVEKKETHLFQQALRSGTSIGANIEEALGGSSRNDFKAKLDIAHKEARETRYWLRLMKDTAIMEPSAADSIIADCEELIKILTSILRTLKSQH